MKRCFKCSKEKELCEFYKHAQMGDGHLNKCIECTKKDVHLRYQQKMATDPVWRERELKRQREKEARAKASRSKPSSGCPKAKAKWYKNNKLKKSAHTAVGNAIRDGHLTKRPCSVCGSNDSEAHHEDYSKPLDVVWYCDTHHKQRHIHLRQLKEYGKIITP